jgi:hypothetical protein
MNNSKHMNREEFAACLLLLGFTRGSHRDTTGSGQRLGLVYNWRCPLTAHPISFYFFSSGVISGYLGATTKIQGATRSTRIYLGQDDNCYYAYRQVVTFQLKCQGSTNGVIVYD